MPWDAVSFHDIGHHMVKGEGMKTCKIVKPECCQDAAKAEFAARQAQLYVDNTPILNTCASVPLDPFDLYRILTRPSRDNFL